MVAFAFLGLFGLALALAYAKSEGNARPRGRFAPSVAWDLTPPLPAPRVRQRALSYARSLGLL
jgi:hypothetical protein